LLFFFFHSRYVNERLLYASSAYVGLAAPGDVGSWQTESKVTSVWTWRILIWIIQRFIYLLLLKKLFFFQSYQFWIRADRRGHFVIKNVRAGNYSLYAWVPGVIGDYKYDANITINPGMIIFPSLFLIKSYL